MDGRQLSYPDGDASLVGELYEPDAPNGASVLVFHEADGIGGNVRRRCAMLAELGYRAFAADLHGAGRPLEGAEMQRAVALLRDHPERFRRRARAGLEALLALPGVDPSRIAAIGYCLGGMAALELARSRAPIAAAVSFHGLLRTRAPAAPGAVTAKVAVFTGARDPLVPAGDIAAFQGEMAAAAADWQLTVYGQAWHAFTIAGVEGLGDARMRYDRVADRLSWAAALALIEEAAGQR